MPRTVVAAGGPNPDELAPMKARLEALEHQVHEVREGMRAIRLVLGGLNPEVEESPEWQQAMEELGSGAPPPQGRGD
jgi:hypothetical protein